MHEEMPYDISSSLKTGLSLDIKTGRIKLDLYIYKCK